MESVTPGPDRAREPLSASAAESGPAAMSALTPDCTELPETFRPRTGAMEAWNGAYVRVEEYLRAHRVHNRLHASRLTHRILERAAHRHERNPARDPAVLAAEEMHALMEEWFGRFVDTRDLPSGTAAIPGRVAMLLTDAPERWPCAFLADEGVPEELAGAMQARTLQAAPDMTVSSMLPQPIDLGPISEAAGETLQQFERWPMLRTVCLWLVFVVALTVIFQATR